ncbi:hypothetical protein [Nocardiopsis suaedae]|uniref:Tail assembly chaperone n=1 Tax=Nocardiopsis suaedae TaxID=3018444 RepID=A0ABT4TMV7_9ACTN|nr:hypothetical protein [Nocardiopsis suaedae]MDA2805701.1 hypothetical protein [Nocardiopsis suaedae]
MESLKEAILAAEDTKQEDIDIPEWGGITVRVKGLSDAQIGAYQAGTTAMRMKSQRGGDVELEMRSQRAKLVVQALFDPDTDRRIFEDSDAPMLAQKNAGVVNGLFVLVQSLSGMDRTFDQQVKDAEGNSSGDQS